MAIIACLDRQRRASLLLDAEVNAQTRQLGAERKSARAGVAGPRAL